MAIPMFDCPFCGNEVPTGAHRCKECFNDLTDVATVSLRGPIIGVILLALVLGAAGMWSWNTRYNQGQLGNAVVDQSHNRVVLIYTSTASQPETRQINFSDIASVEMEARDFILAGSIWEVFLVTSSNERVLLKTSLKASLETYAATIAQQTNKQLTIINKIKGGEGFLGQG